MGLEPDIIRIVSTPYTSVCLNNDETDDNLDGRQITEMWDRYNNACQQIVTVWGHHWTPCFNWKCIVKPNCSLPSTVAVSQNVLPVINQTLNDIWSGVANYSSYVFMLVNRNIDKNCYTHYKLIDASNLNDEICYSNYCLNLPKRRRNSVVCFSYQRGLLQMSRDNIIEKNHRSVNRKMV